MLIPDETIDQGGCVLETSAGFIDARMKTQLEKIKYSLDTVSNESAGSIDEDMFERNDQGLQDAEA
jgi:flagellar biosynthesis/type III secretory pathway protein FliH